MKLKISDKKLRSRFVLAVRRSSGWEISGFDNERQLLTYIKKIGG